MSREETEAWLRLAIQDAQAGGLRTANVREIARAALEAALTQPNGGQND